MDNILRVNATTACCPDKNYIDACLMIDSGIHEPFLGELSKEYVQLCSQNAGYLDEFTVRFIKKVLPDTKLRLHSSAKVARMVKGYYPGYYGTEEASAFFEGIKRVSHEIGAEAYTIHAGTREVSLDLLRSKILRMEDDYGFMVGVEGLYPNGSRNSWLINSWEEYAWLLTAGIHYAIDMSHLNILVKSSGITNDGLVKELLNSANCIEIHVSDNDGDRDSHRPITDEPWWYGLMQYKSQEAILFSEGMAAYR